MPQYLRKLYSNVVSIDRVVGNYTPYTLRFKPYVNPPNDLLSLYLISTIVYDDFLPTRVDMQVTKVSSVQTMFSSDCKKRYEYVAGQIHSSFGRLLEVKCSSDEGGEDRDLMS